MKIKENEDPFEASVDEEPPRRSTRRRAGSNRGDTHSTKMVTSGPSVRMTRREINVVRIAQPMGMTRNRSRETRAKTCT
jgi:hypothetical protein